MRHRFYLVSASYRKSGCKRGATQKRALDGKLKYLRTEVTLSKRWFELQTDRSKFELVDKITPRQQQFKVRKLTTVVYKIIYLNSEQKFYFSVSWLQQIQFWV